MHYDDVRETYSIMSDWSPYRQLSPLGSHLGNGPMQDFVLSKWRVREPPGNKNCTYLITSHIWWWLCPKINFPLVIFPIRTECARFHLCQCNHTIAFICFLLAVLKQRIGFCHLYIIQPPSLCYRLFCSGFFKCFFISLIPCVVRRTALDLENVLFEFLF